MTARPDPAETFLGYWITEGRSPDGPGFFVAHPSWNGAPEGPFPTREAAMAWIGTR
jgi:hypothetical protein